jgi:hypothetical protein
LDKVGKGQVRVSRTAVSILHPSDDQERLAALAQAGGSPTLFKKIRDAFPEEPSERTITSFLIREGFTDVAIPAVLKSYRETNRFLAASGVSESYGKGDSDEADSSSNYEDDEPMTELTAVATPPRAAAARVEAPEIDSPLDFKISSGRLTLMGSTVSPSAAKAFLPKLQAAIEFFAVVAAEPEVEDDGFDL